MKDLNTLIKTAVLKQLINDKGVTNLVKANRIYGQGVPSKPDFPFIRYGLAVLTPFDPSGFDGVNARISLHAFCETTNKQAAEDSASKVATAIINAMEGFASSELSLLDCAFIQSTILQEDGGRAHATIEFSILAAPAQ